MSDRWWWIMYSFSIYRTHIEAGARVVSRDTLGRARSFLGRRRRTGSELAPAITVFHKEQAALGASRFHCGGECYEGSGVGERRKGEERELVPLLSTGAPSHIHVS